MSASTKSKYITKLYLFTCNAGQQYNNSWEDTERLSLLTHACLQPQLEGHHIKLAASSQDMCRTPHGIRHSVDIAFNSSWYPQSPCFILMLPSSVLCSLQCMCSVLPSASAAVGLLLGGHVTGLSAVCELCVGHKIKVWSCIGYFRSSLHTRCVHGANIGEDLVDSDSSITRVKLPVPASSFF